MTDDRIDRLEKLVLDAISELKSEVTELKSDVTELKSEVTELKSEFADMKNDAKSFDNKFENYQKATQSVVNLAFGLIASATIVTLASSIFRR
jgi:FtsZ-binding cell division protein ZapB